MKWQSKYLITYFYLIMYLNTIIRSASAVHARMFLILIEHKVIFVAQKLVQNNCTIICIFVYCHTTVNLRVIIFHQVVIIENFYHSILLEIRPKQMQNIIGVYIALPIQLHQPPNSYGN